MNIEMINASEKSASLMEKTKYGNQPADKSRMTEQMVGYSIDITGKVKENAAYGKKDLLSAEEISTQAGLVDVSMQRNYMAVMSNSMSDEDFSELLKDGCNPTHTKIEESVTNLDKIKAKMAQSGNIVEGFNDDMSQEELTSALGGSVNAGAIATSVEKAIQSSDLPVTAENVQSVIDAMDIASKLSPIDEATSAYIIKNEMEPTISNLYVAQHSTSSANNSKLGNVVVSGGMAYATAKETDASWDKIKDQAVRILEESGLPDNDENLQKAKWLIENQIPLSGDNIRALNEIESIKLPAKEDTLLKSMMVALSEGKSPSEANLLKTENIYEKSAAIIKEFDEAISAADVSKRRQLEEVRLEMTVEANLTLLRKGITIDTKNLENLVDMLKEAEKEFYSPLLESDNSEESLNITDNGDLESKISLFKQTTLVTEYLRKAPAQSVGELIKTREEINLDNIHTKAHALTAEFEKAGKSYETLMTAPRADMGDSITKAFRNVDDILKDLNLALSEDNRKSVRIMGYSEIQMTREAVEETRQALKSVENVIEMMTPSRTLKMIREGHNPLTENIFELEKSLKEESVEETTEKYSEFLVKLEKHDDISEDEKSAYIGLYRLFDKIEKKDSRVIGKVLSAGEDLTLKNLLTAYRSGKLGSIDINVDDEFGLLENVIRNGESITEQIEKGFRNVKEEETPKQYISDKQEMISEASLAGRAGDFLEEIEIPVNVENILAANDFIHAGKSTFKKITSESEENEKSSEAKEAIRQSSKKVIDSFEDSEGARANYESFVKEAVDISSNLMTKSDSYSEIKEWSRFHKQINIAGNLAKRDEFEIPVETEDGYLSIRLKINQSSDHDGKVEASFESERYGTIKAAFSLNENNVLGIVSAKYNGGFDMIKEKEDNIKASLSKSGFTVGSIAYVRTQGNIEDAMTPEGNATNNNLFRVAKAFLTAMEKGEV